MTGMTGFALSTVLSVYASKTQYIGYIAHTAHKAKPVIPVILPLERTQKFSVDQIRR